MPHDGVSRLAFSCVLALLAQAALAASFSGRVVGVTDGDTLKVLHAGREERVRLYGVDAPEKRQAFGARAKEHASDLAFGKTVLVEEKDRDRYGRTVAVVVLPDGRSLNVEMIRAGLAWWYRRYAPVERDLEGAEEEAKRARRGLWADPEPLPPWEFRKKARGRQASRREPQEGGRIDARP